MKKLLLATVALVALSATAMAGTINLRLQEDAGPTQDFLGAPGQSSFSATNQAFGDFLISNITGSTTPDTISPVLLSSNTLDIQTTGTGPHLLNVWITGNGLTSPLGLVNTFTNFTNVALSNGWSVTLDSLFSATDAMFTGMLLNTTTFTGGPIPTAFADNGFANADFGSGPFSLTAHYLVSTDGIGQANSGITIGATEATPIPGAIWLFGGGAGLLGMFARGKRKRRTAWDKVTTA